MSAVPNRATRSVPPLALASKVSCTRCIYDEATPSIVFDEQGVCNYCQMHDRLCEEYPIGDEGQQRLRKLADEIRKAGRNKKYDVVVGVSGGCDSSYMLLQAKELGLRPLAVHFDNTWNSTTATENIHSVLKALQVDLFTYVVDNEEYDDLYRSFLAAGTADTDGPTDIALAVVMYMACKKHGINYMFEGHSFRTEGVSPLGWFYIDGKYIQSVQDTYGTRKLKTFPNLSLFRFLKWTMFSKIKKIRPLYYIDYRKEEVKQMLTRDLGWKWYGGHHLENRFTAFCHSYLLPQRFGIDHRLNGHSALVRTGQMSREEGLQAIASLPEYDPELIELVKKRLGYTDVEFERLMTQPKRTYRDFKNYKSTFERLRPLFWLLYKMERVPKSFYIKYTSKSSI